MSDIGGMFSGIGTGIQDLFAASGDKADAASLNKAAGMEDTNAKIAAASGEIQQAAAQRDIYKVLGGQAQDIATAGFQTGGGSAGDLARASAQEGHITQALIENQTSIDVQGFKIQAATDRAEAASAQRSAQASTFGGILGIATGIFSLFSDASIKLNVKPVGTGKLGLTLYEYNYVGDETKYRGYLAQDVEKVRPEAVMEMGLKMIDREFAPVKVANA